MPKKFLTFTLTRHSRLTLTPTCRQSSWRTARCTLAHRGRTHKAASAWHMPGKPPRAEATQGACSKHARTMRGLHTGTLKASRKEHLHFWEPTYLHRPDEALSVLASLPQNSYWRLSSHPPVNADLANQLCWHLCCVFGPKCSRAIHKVNLKMLQHHSSYREEASWHCYTHTSSCRVDITKYTNTFFIIYSVYKNIASNWTLHQQQKEG